MSVERGRRVGRVAWSLEMAPESEVCEEVEKTKDWDRCWISQTQKG